MDIRKNLALIIAGLALTCSVAGLVNTLVFDAKYGKKDTSPSPSPSPVTAPAADLPPVAVDSPTTDDFFKLASTYGKIDYVLLFCSSHNDSYYYSLTVSYDESEGIDKIEINNKASMSVLYQMFDRMLNRLKEE